MQQESNKQPFQQYYNTNSDNMTLKANILTKKAGAASLLELGGEVVAHYNRAHARAECRSQLAAGSDFGGKISTCGRVTSQYGRRHIFEGKTGISWARGISVQGIDHLLASDGPMSTRMLVGVLTPPSEYARRCCRDEGWVDALSLLTTQQLDEAYDDVMDGVAAGEQYERAMAPLSRALADAVQPLRPSRLTIIYAPTVEFFRLSGITLGAALTTSDGAVADGAHWGTKASYTSMSAYIKTSDGSGVYTSKGFYEFLGACYSLLGHCQVKVGAPKLLWDMPEIPEPLGWTEEADLDATYECVMSGLLSDNAMTRQARYRGMTSYRGLGYGLDNWSRFISLCQVNCEAPLEGIDLSVALADVGYAAESFLKAGKAMAVYDILAHHANDSASFTLALAIHRKLYDRQVRRLGAGADLLYRVKQKSWDYVMATLLDMVAESGEFMGRKLDKEEYTLLTDMVYLGRPGTQGMYSAVQSELDRLNYNSVPDLAEFKTTIGSHAYREDPSTPSNAGIEVVDAMLDRQLDQYSAQQVALAQLLASEANVLPEGNPAIKVVYQCAWLVLNTNGDEGAWLSLMHHCLRCDDDVAGTLSDCISANLMDTALYYRERGAHDLLSRLVADTFTIACRARRNGGEVVPNDKWALSPWAVKAYTGGISETVAIGEQPGGASLERGEWLLKFCERPSVVVLEMVSMCRYVSDRAGADWASIGRSWLDRGANSGANRADVIGMIGALSDHTPNVIKRALRLKPGLNRSGRLARIVASAGTPQIIQYNEVLLQGGLLLSRWLEEEASWHHCHVDARLVQWGDWFLEPNRHAPQ